MEYASGGVIREQVAPLKSPCVIHGSECDGRFGFELVIHSDGTASRVPSYICGNHG